MGSLRFLGLEVPPLLKGWVPWTAQTAATSRMLDRKSPHEVRTKRSACNVVCRAFRTGAQEDRCSSMAFGKRRVARVEASCLRSGRVPSRCLAVSRDGAP